MVAGPAPPGADAFGTTEPFGTSAGGAAASLVTLGRPGGPIACITDHGATLVALYLPDRDGNLEDVVLGFDVAEGYRSADNAYLGATVGRVANRIAGAAFTIGRQRYRLTANEPPNHLHGGSERALSRVRWDLVHVTPDLVELAYASPDGEEGYPGRLRVEASYRLLARGLVIDYRAVTDATTPVSLTHHTYWNLAGAGNGTVLDHRLQVAASAYTPTDETLIPTGEIVPVDGTPLDLRRPVPVGAGLPDLRATPARGYDHNLVLDGPTGRLRFAARLHDPGSGRVVELHTDQPALQVYSGNGLRGQRGKAGRLYDRHGGICLEPQHHPDAVNQPTFPSVLLRPGAVYRHTSALGFGAA